MTLLTPAMVFRKWVTDGVPESGAHDPKKGEIVQLLDSLFGVTRGGWVVALTKADLLAVTPTDETDGGVVLDDPDPTLNGYYGRDAAAWVQGRGFPDTLALVTLGGTANAQTGTFSSGVDAGNVLEFIATPGTANTGPMTLSHDGETPKPVLNYAGNALSAGEWATFVRYRDDGLGNYRLTIDANSAAVASAAATVATNKAIEAAASAALSGPTGVYSGTFTGNGIGTTFALPVEPTSAAHVWVAIDGILQAPATYTVDALNLIFTEAPHETLDEDFVPIANISYRMVSIAAGESVPPDGSVTSTKLALLAVTTDKIADLAVTTGKIADVAVTKAKVSPSAIGDTEIDGTEAGAIRTKLGVVPGADVQAFDAQTALPGSVVQSGTASNATWVAIATAIPFDDSLPQVGEGTQILSVAITPKSTTNKLRVRFVGYASGDGLINLIAALFVNGGANAVRVTFITSPAAGYGVNLALEYEYIPAALTAQTLTLRVGPSSGNMYMNGNNTSRRFGGAGAASLTVEEIKA